MKKIYIVILYCLLFIWLSPSIVFAQDLCQSNDPCAGKSVEDSVTCYQSVIDSCGKAKETLASQIHLLDTQIQLTTFQISSIKKIIATFSIEITELENEIVRLDLIIKTRLELLVSRIPESYKRSVAPNFGLVLLSSNITDVIARVKYIMFVQKENARLYTQLQLTQNNYNDRKKLREDKKIRQEAAKKELEQKNAQVAQQKKEKNALLEVTQGNEATYQQLLSQAKIQVAAMKGFVSSVGGTTILTNQTSCSDWGCYYSQRDAAWANNRMGSSYETILNVGCYITSVAMVATHYKKDIKPSDIAAESSAFVSPTAYMWWSYKVKGVSVSLSRGGLDSELAQGRPVIVGLRAGPAHFIVIKSGSNGHYIMNDPVIENGHDLDFSSHYNTSDITEVMNISIN
jgi:peptidoglycan hydrolase CwlO-like protein